MKKLFAMMFAITVASSAFAQSEPFVKALTKLRFGTTILDGAMMMKKDFPQYKATSTAPIAIATLANVKDPAKPYNIEAFYYVNDKTQEVIELQYVNGGLYEKAALWYFHKDSIAAVETKYKKCNNTLLSNPALLEAGKGSVTHNEEKFELGARTSFPIEKLGTNVREGETGYNLVYTPETAGRGFWVYMKMINTIQPDFKTTDEIPQIKSPNETFDELKATLTQK